MLRVKDYTSEELNELSKKELRELALDESIEGQRELLLSTEQLVEQKERGTIIAVVVTAILVALVTVGICSQTMGETQLYDGMKLRGFFPIVMTAKCEREYDGDGGGAFYYGSEKVSRSFCEDWIKKECENINATDGYDRQRKCQMLRSDAGL